VIDLNSFGQFLDEQDATDARASAIAAPQVSPDDMGQAVSLAKKRNLPAGVVADNLPDYREQDHLDAVQAAGKQSPAAARWFQTPEHAALAKGEPDKVGTLATLLEPFNMPLAWASRGIDAVRKGVLRGRAGESFVQGDIAQFANTDQAIADLLDMPSEGLRGLLNALPATYKGKPLGDSFDPLGTRAESERAAGISAAVRAAQQDTAIAVGGRPTFAQFKADPLAAIEQAAAHYTRLGAGSAPGMLFAATGNPQLAASAMAVPQGTQSYSDLVAQGVPKWKAAGAGVASAGAEFVGEEFGLGRLLRGDSVFGGIASESLQEAATQEMQDRAEGFASGQQMTTAEHLSNDFDAAVLGGLFGSAIRGGQGLVHLAAGAEGSRQLGDVVQQVGDMKLGKLAPDALHALASEAAPDAHVYLAADQARTLFQSDRASADQFVGELTGNPDALREAEATGGDVVIPMADFVARVATLPNAADVAKHARLHPEHLSRAELENEDALNEHLASIFGEDMTVDEGGDTAADSSEQVTQDMTAQLLASGTYRPADAELMGKLAGRMFGMAAGREGVDAHELYSRYDVRVNGPGTPAQRSLLQRAGDGLRSLFQPARPVYGSDPLLAGMALLAQNDESFQLPVSSAKTLEGVVADVEGDHGFKVIKDEFTDSFAREEAGADRGWMIRSPRGEGGRVFASKDAVWIDVADFKQGGGGRRVYNAVANYAHNVGKVFIGDPAGLSDVAQARRLENMLSSALKFGTTAHLWPHAKQLTGNANTLVPSIDWKDGDHAHNLSQMLHASLASLEAQFPEIVNLRYDPAHDEIRDIRTGEPRSRHSLKLLAQSAREGAPASARDRPRPSAITGGSTSIERAVLAASLLRGSREEQAAILARLGGQRSQRLERVLYQQTPPTGGVSALGQPDGTGAPRGQLRIGTNRSMSIDLLKGADLSTFIHELGHLSLEVMTDVAEKSPAVAADLAQLRHAIGNDGGAFTEDQHEQVARLFEAYVREGKAPAPELRGMFARMRAWLLDVYRNLRDLNVTLTDQVRGVFDRMLATDDEIEAAQVRQGMQPLNLAPESRALLSDSQWNTYVAALQDATEEARSEVLQKLLAAHKREAQAWWQEQQVKTREQVEAEFEAAPVVRAWRILSGRTQVDGAEVPEHLRGLRLDRAALVAMTSEQWVKEKLHRLGVYRKEGGVHPDTAALALGFDSGDALVKSLAEVRDLQARITAEVDRRMHERHPDPLTDGSLPERAMDAVHSVKRVVALESELAIIAKLANQPAPPARLVREYARRKIAGLTLRGIRPNDYLTAERKAAREAAKAAAQGDYAEALQHKRAQALNVALYAEASGAQDKAQSQIAALKALASDKSRERVGKAGKSYLDALDSVLEGHELRAASGAEVRRRDALRAWADSQQDEMGDTILSQDLLDRIEAERVVNVRDLTVHQLTDLHETASNIAHLARLKNTLLKGKDKREWADAKDDLVTGMRAALDAGKPPPLSAADLSLLERAGQGYGQFMDWMLRPETIVEWLDGGESGPWHDYFWAPMEAGEQARNALRRSIAEPLTKLLTDLPKAERAALDEVVSVPEIGRSVSRNTILSALLNLGTASSRDKLLRGGMMIDGEVLPFHPEQVAAMLRHLSPAQANLAQQVWDALDTLWPHIQAQQEALSGFAPDKLEALPVTFTASDGTQVALRGGYYPAAYDPRAGNVGSQQQDSEKLLGSDFTRATTSKGYTKERTQYAAPMLLDYHAVLSRHLNQAITDLAYRQPLRQMLRVLADPTIKGIVGQRLSPSAWSVLDGSVKATIRGTTGMIEPASAFFEKVKAGVIRNTVVAALGLKVGLLVANTVTAPLLATARVKTRFVVDGLAQYYRHPAKMTALVHELSPFMADRATHTGQGYDDILAELRGKHGIRHRIAEASLAMHHWINPLVERGIWLGRYLQAQHEGAGIEESVRLADKSIRQTQTQAAPKDLSAVERDPRYKVFNLFLGPMVIANNRLQDAGLRGKLHGAVATPAVALGTWFAMTVANGALFDLLSGRTPDDEDDDGLDWADWSTWLARKAALFPFQTMPFIRNAANLFDGSKSARPDPLTEAMALMVKFGKSVQAHALDAWQGDHDAQVQLTKDTARAAGVAVGVPSTQAVITGGNLYDAATGDEPITSPLDARYLIYRRQK
jgi:hypothetical protein